MRKGTIVIGRKGVGFPLLKGQLLWKDVGDRAVVRVLGVEWVRITDRSGKRFRILLTLPGGRQFRKKLLGVLGLTTGRLS